jgi:lysozyme family protein
VTEIEVLAEIRRNEGDRVKNDPADPQDPSKYGIGAETLGNWRGLRRRATLEEVTNLTWGEASDIYRVRYIDQPGFTVRRVEYEPLRLQLIDFGVNSGPERASR